jgi:inhibitor of apoptosis domain-containing protein
MWTFEARKESFKVHKWPHKTPSPEAMAQAGFLCKPIPGRPDNAACFACEKSLDGWSESDSPYNEHIKHSRECALVRLDLTSGRAASFVHGHWPHSQHLLPHTVIANVE